MKFEDNSGKSGSRDASFPEGMINPSMISNNNNELDYDEPPTNMIRNAPIQTLLPMSPLAASVTVINLILATGPFT